MSDKVARAIFWWGYIGLVITCICLFTGCTTILPQTYRVPLLITQDAMHRLPYSDINN